MTEEGRATVRLTLEVPHESEEQLVAELWAFGTLGIETVGIETVGIETEGIETVGIETGEAADRVRLEAYFDAEAMPPNDLLETAVRGCDAVLAGAGPVAARDWLADYRARCEPISIGPVVIDPGEPGAVEAPPGEKVLRIPARNAFGTGSHESTRLMVEALIATDLADLSLLDVGTGSAILALVALRLGARSAVGCDIDVGSVVTARDNARFNREHPLLLAGGVEALGGEFDLILVNILPHRWLDRAAAVIARLAPGGELLVSGLLTTEAPTALERLSGLGLKEAGRLEVGEWSALRLRWFS